MGCHALLQGQGGIEPSIEPVSVASTYIGRRVLYHWQYLYTSPQMVRFYHQSHPGMFAEYDVPSPGE